MTGSTNASTSSSTIEEENLVNDISKLLDTQTKQIVSKSTPIDTLIDARIASKINSKNSPLNEIISTMITEKINSGNISLSTMIQNNSRIYKTTTFGNIVCTPANNRQNKTYWVHNTIEGKGKITLLIDDRSEDDTSAIYDLVIDGVSAETVLNVGESAMNAWFSTKGNSVTFEFEKGFDIVIPEGNNISYLLQLV